MQRHSTLHKASVIVGVLLFSISGLTVNAHAKEAEKIDIPVVENARIFAQFDDKIPAVVNYFTSAKEAQVIEFYSTQYGEPIQQERKRGRLTLNFNNAPYNVRVVISQQNNARQVDVIVEGDN